MFEVDEYILYTVFKGEKWLCEGPVLKTEDAAYDAAAEIGDVTQIIHISSDAPTKDVTERFASRWLDDYEPGFNEDVNDFWGRVPTFVKKSFNWQEIERTFHDKNGWWAA